jgi:CHAD domain-containing protein
MNRHTEQEWQFTAPPGDAAQTGISAAQPFADAQRALLRRSFAAALEQEPRVRAGSVAAVHDMRIAMRHLEVLLRAWRGYGPAWAMGARPRVRALIGALGAVRDADVQLGFLARQDGLAALEAIEPIRARLQAEREKAQARLRLVLDSPAIRSWRQGWTQHLEAHSPGSVRAQRAATAAVARGSIRHAARSLRKRARRIEDASPPQDFHQVRIRAKRLRYTLDAYASLYGDAALSYTEALGKLQTVLGELHDATVRERRFAQLVEATPALSAATSFLAGRLVGQDARALMRGRRKFAKAYRRVSRQRWRELDAVMKQVEHQAATARPGAER